MKGRQVTKVHVPSCRRHWPKKHVIWDIYKLVRHHCHVNSALQGSYVTPVHPENSWFCWETVSWHEILRYFSWYGVTSSFVTNLNICSTIVCCFIILTVPFEWHSSLLHIVLNLQFWICTSFQSVGIQYFSVSEYLILLYAVAVLHPRFNFGKGVIR